METGEPHVQDKELTEPSVDPVSDILKWVLLVAAIICFAPSRLGHGADLREGAAPAAGIHRPRRQRADDGRRHRRRKGRLPEGRPDGLRQHLRHGVVFRRGLHRLDAGAARRADQAKPRQFRRTPPSTKAPGNKSLADTGPPERRPWRRPQPPHRPRCARRRGHHRDDAEAAPGNRPHPVDSRLPDAVAQAIRGARAELTTKLNTVNLSAGWVPAKALDPALRAQTADFIIYSAITTVARRPDYPNTSWTENWPYEPSVGNTPTTNTFRWTWISFCFTFFAMGFVLWLYRAYLDHPDDAPMERGLPSIAR